MLYVDSKYSLYFMKPTTMVKKKEKHASESKRINNIKVFQKKYE